MNRYFLKRIVHSVFILVGVSLVTFLLVHMTGDPVTLFLPLDAGPEDIEAVRVALGFDRPIYQQYLGFLRGAVRGDFGTSMRHREEAMGLVLDRLPATMQLTFAAMAVAVAVAVPLGVIAATHRDSLASLVASVLGLLGQSMPVFWLGIMMILLLSVNLGWFPASGRGGFIHLVMPAVAIGTYSMAAVMRMMRSTMIEVLGLDFIRTARAKGVSERAVVYKHGLRNALIPVVTVTGLRFGTLLGGAVITETVFAWPGLGRFLIQGLNNRDMPVVQASVFVMALMIVAVNLLTDLVYSYLDPTVRFS
ncbi:MAG: ABC transporter permease [Bacillota bacterium]